MKKRLSLLIATIALLVVSVRRMGIGYIDMSAAETQLSIA